MTQVGETTKTLINAPRRVVRALIAAVLRFDHNGGWVFSSHVAMSMMLALFPFTLFIVALAGFLSQDVDVDDLVELVFGSWPDEIAQPIVTQVRAVVANTDSGLMTLGGVLAIHFSSNGVDAVRVAMTQAYRDTDPRPFWQARLLCIVFVLVGGALVLAAATFGLAVPLFVSHFPEAAQGWMVGWVTDDRLNLFFTMGMLVLAVMACHVWLPGHRHSLLQILPGIVLTLALWIATAWGFAAYLSHFASYSAIYAGLAGTMAALIFMYLMAAILILGAEFNGALAHERNLEST